MTTASPMTGIQDKHLEYEQFKCDQLINNYSKRNEGESVASTCDPIWDGIMCWNATKATVLQQPCPWYIAGFDPKMNASKECLDNGTWFIRKLTPWTNFTQCYSKDQVTVVVGVEKEETYITPYLPFLKTIAEVGYSISLISLVMAFIILFSFKKLRCPRNKLHMHLFASFIMRAFMTLLKDCLFVEGLATRTDVFTNTEGTFLNINEQTKWICRMIISIWQYFIMANCSWILMEALYLHNLIFLALFTDSSSITLYCFLGWGLPLIFVIPWTLCRVTLENLYCWTINDNRIVFLLIRGPTTATIVISFVLFINILRVLLRKLQSSISEETKTYRLKRGAKSTLILIPLFGIHYMLLLGLQYNNNNMVELVWLFCDQLFSSLNGFFVALLYCFINGEVRNELARKWEHFSIRELLESCHLVGRNSIFSTFPFVGNERHHRPRGSCNSSASCILDSYVHSNTREKKRNLIVHTATVQGTKGISGNKKIDVRVVTDCGFDTSEVKNGDSNKGKDRRWSNSDCDLENNAVELKSMTSPDTIVNL